MTDILLVITAVTLRIVSNPVGNVFQKQLTALGHHPLQVNFLTYLLLSAACLPFLFLVDVPSLPADFWLYSILGGIVGATGNSFLVRALEKGELSVLGPINAYKSVVGLLFGILLLGEIPNGWGLLGIALIIAGSYFVLDTTREKFSFALLKKPEIKFRLWALVLTAIEAVFVKKVILASSSGTAFISWCIFGAFFAFIFLRLHRTELSAVTAMTNRPANSLLNRQSYTRFLLLILCIGTMQLTTNYAFDHMPVGYALSLFQLSVIVSVLLGHRIFQEKDIGKKLFGSLVMIAGSLLIILGKGD